MRRSPTERGGEVGKACGVLPTALSKGQPWKLFISLLFDEWSSISVPLQTDWCQRGLFIVKFSPCGGSQAWAQTGALVRGARA